MKIIDVSSYTNSSVAAMALAYSVLQDGPVQAQVRSGAAVQPMPSALEAVQAYLFAKGKSLLPIVSDLVSQESRDMIAAIRLMVDETTPAADPLPSETIEEEVAEDFAERQAMLTGENELVEKLIEHTAESPILSGGDLDAAWDQADVGEETVGGTVSTPGQDRVDLLGEAVGLSYEDDEPLHTEEKLEERDRHRWELDPRSAETNEDELH